MTLFTVRKLLIILPLLYVHTSALGPYLSQQEAIALDAELFQNYKFSPLQLIELAGLSAASAIAYTYPLPRRVLVVYGPGNNGGDGLVCARHLKMFGYDTVLYRSNPTNKPTPHENLVHQCTSMNISQLNESPIPGIEEMNNNYDLIVDALFGVSFKPPLRQEFKDIVDNLSKTKTPIASIDVPSGWNVETGPPPINDIQPECLISISAPKLCSKFFNGKHHFLGGRFLPTAMQEKYNMSKLPRFPSNKCFVKLNRNNITLNASS